MLRLRRYERISIDNRRFCSNGVSLAQNFRYEGSSSTNHSSNWKTRINVLSYGIRMWAQVSFVLSQRTRLTDRQTDGQPKRPSQYRALQITCSRTLKIVVRIFYGFSRHQNRQRATASTTEDISFHNAPGHVAQ